MASWSSLPRRAFVRMTSLGIVGLPLAAVGPTGGRGGQEWPDLGDSILINGLGGIFNPNLRLGASDEDPDQGPISEPGGTPGRGSRGSSG